MALFPAVARLCPGGCSRGVVAALQISIGDTGLRCWKVAERKDGLETAFTAEWVAGVVVMLDLEKQTGNCILQRTKGCIPRQHCRQESPWGIEMQSGRRKWYGRSCHTEVGRVFPKYSSSVGLGGHNVQRGVLLFLCKEGCRCHKRTALDDVLAAPHPMVPLHLFDPPHPLSTIHHSSCHPQQDHDKRFRVGRVLWKAGKGQTDCPLPCPSLPVVNVAGARSGDLGNVFQHRPPARTRTKNSRRSPPHYLLCKELACRYARFRCMRVWGCKGCRGCSGMQWLRAGPTS